MKIASEQVSENFFDDLCGIDFLRHGAAKFFDAVVIEAIYGENQLRYQLAASTAVTVGQRDRNDEATGRCFFAA